jgi:hypothetical protein
MRTYTLAPMARPSVKLSFGQFAGFEAGWLPWPTPDALASTVRRWLRAQPRATGSTRGDWQGRGLRGPWLVGLDAEARPMARWVPAPMDVCCAKATPMASGRAIGWCPDHFRPVY